MNATPNTVGQRPPLERILCGPKSMLIPEMRNKECHAFHIYERRNDFVREVAYRRAQARGFAPGHELEDWVAAEREVDGKLFAQIAPVGFTG